MLVADSESELLSRARRACELLPSVCVRSASAPFTFASDAPRRVDERQVARRGVRVREVPEAPRLPPGVGEVVGRPRSDSATGPAPHRRLVGRRLRRDLTTALELGAPEGLAMRCPESPSSCSPQASQLKRFKGLEDPQRPQKVPAFNFHCSKTTSAPKVVRFLDVFWAHGRDRIR